MITLSEAIWLRSYGSRGGPGQWFLSWSELSNPEDAPIFHIPIYGAIQETEDSMLKDSWHYELIKDPNGWRLP